MCGSCIAKNEPCRSILMKFGVLVKLSKPFKNFTFCFYTTDNMNGSKINFTNFLPCSAKLNFNGLIPKMCLVYSFKT